MNWLSCGLSLCVPTLCSQDIKLRLRSRASGGLVTTVAVLAVSLWLVPVAASAQATAMWATPPDTSPGVPTYFSDPLSACVYQHQYYSAPTAFYGETPYNDWAHYLCQWEFRIGYSWPTVIYLVCLNSNGQPDGNYKLEPPGICVANNEPNVSRPCNCEYNKGANFNPTAGDPVVLSTGSLYERVTDYQDADKRLTISRTYRSRPASDGGSFPVYPLPYGLGDLWRHSFQWELQLHTTYFTYTGSFGVNTPDGSNYSFSLATNGSVSANNYGVNDISVQFVNPGGGQISYANILSNGGQFQITTSDGDQVLIGLFVPYWSTQYVAGRPLQITYRGGYVWTFNYGSQGQVQSITDNLGRTISLTWSYSAVRGGSASSDRFLVGISGSA